MATVIRRRGGSSSVVSRDAPKPSPVPDPPKPPPERKVRKSNVGGSQKDEGGWEEWLSKLEGVNAWAGVNTMKAQWAAANALANRLRNFLAEGIDPELSPFTKALSSDHKPLSTLAKHVIVKLPYTRQLRIPKGKPGAGRFSGQSHPAIVTIEPGWEHIAYTLEHGKVFQVDPKVRAALIAEAKENGFQLEEGMGTGGVWIIPPRPFSHVLTSGDAESEVKQIVEDVFSGRSLPKSEREPWMDVLEEDPDAGQPQFVSWDDVGGMIEDPAAMDFESLILDHYSGGAGGGSEGGGYRYSSSSGGRRKRPKRY